MPYKPPKGITSHPAVKTCECAIDHGADEYRHYVELKDGWVFRNGRNAGSGCLFVKTVGEFLFATPMEEDAYLAEMKAWEARHGQEG